MSLNKGLPKTVPCADLRPGDHIKLTGINVYGGAIVEYVTPQGMAHVIRPYMTCTDFVIGDPPSVIVYTGHEHFHISGEALLVERTNLRSRRGVERRKTTGDLNTDGIKRSRIDRRRSYEVG